MDKRKVTRLVVTATIILIGLYDLVAISLWGVGATVSRVVLSDATVAPTIPLAVGYVLGHLFWGQKPKPKELSD